VRLLEKKIEQNVVDWWEAKGGVVIKLNLHGRKGWPDRQFFPHGGKPVFIEFKQVDEKARKLQSYIHGLLKDRGYEVHVVDTIAQGKAILARALLSKGCG